MDKKLNQLFIKDSAIVLFMLAALWSTLIFIMSKTCSLGANGVVRTVVISAGVLVGSFAAASSIAVVAHLNKNKTQVYTEEILCLSHIDIKINHGDELNEE